ncbi:MAG: hypothetical protein FWB77_04500 [Treponema sp.]|nr:hypothetical protein [Treponema sp.]
MPNLIKQIKETMVKKGISEEIISQFNFTENKENQSEIIMDIIDQMDKLLSKEQCLSIMEEQGCCTSGKPAKAHQDFGKKYSDKSIKEKIKLFDKLDTPHKYFCILNEDGTLSVYWGVGNEENYICVCGFIKKLSSQRKVSKTFCGCCGAHARKNLQRSLGAKLKLKKIVSSAISSKGKKRCEFIFQIENESKK